MVIAILFCILYTLSAPVRWPLSGALVRSPDLFLKWDQGFILPAKISVEISG
jgi:hypothetical protein